MVGEGSGKFKVARENIMTQRNRDAEFMKNKLIENTSVPLRLCVEKTRGTEHG